MEILVKDPEERDRLLSEWKLEEVFFTPVINSTSVINGILSNVDIHEEDLIDIDGDSCVVGIDSNYYHWRNPDYITKVRKSRTPKKVTKKPRSLQGDGKSFNSQITFMVLGEHIRYNPNIMVKGVSQKLRNDKHAKNATELEDNTEKIIKPYKVKLFRNGKISIPGVLTDDLSDADMVIKNFTEYLSNLFDADVRLINRWTTTRNYKFMTLNGNLDLIKFQEYCNRHFTTLLNTRWENIEGFIIKPLWMAKESCHMISTEPQLMADFMGIYNGYTMLKYMDDDISALTPEEKTRKTRERIERGLPYQVINLGGFYQHLHSCDKVKNLYVNFSDLCKKLLNLNLMEWHHAIDKYLAKIYKDYFVTLSDKIIERIRRIVLQPLIHSLHVAFKKSKNNMISHINYNPEIYAGFIVRIKTPTEEDAQKQTTIKLFSSGKINIDGANNLAEAEFIYYWLNHIFNENPDFIYDENEEVEESDDGFSYTDDEDDE